MYICPICQKFFKTEQQVVKHSLACWREYNSNHIPKPAPRREDIVKREVNNNILDFFNSYKGDK